MQLKTIFALIGALIAAAGVTGGFIGFGLHWIYLLTVGVLVIVGYVIASIAGNPKNRTTAFGEFMRGWLVGMNAAANGVIAYSLVGLFAGLAGGLIVGLTLGVLNLLTSIGPLSRNEFCQGIFGYLNWFLPMSWPIVATGILFVLISALLHAVTIGKVRYLKMEGMRMDWKTGTLFFKGGLVANLNYIDTAFNMGNFSFVDYKSSKWHIEHEAGHTLNLAAFGFVFHLVGALDENVLRRGANALAERFAESNVKVTSRPIYPMWA